MMEYQEVNEGQNEILDYSVSEFRKIFFGTGVVWDIFDDNGESVLGLIDLKTGEVLILGREDK